MNITFSRRIIASLFVAVLVVSCGLVLSGCTTSLSPWAKRTMKSADMLSTVDLMAEANRAWVNQEYQASELYYSSALLRPDLASSLRPLAEGRLGLSACHNEHYHQALSSLEKWAKLEKNVVSRWDWLESYQKTIAALNRTHRLEQHLAWVLQQNALPWATRSKVATWYANYYEEKKAWKEGLVALESFYAVAPNRAAQGALERSYYAKLTESSDSRVAKLGQYATASNGFRFPYALVSFERARRAGENKKQWGAAWRTMQAIIANANLVDRYQLSNRLGELESQYGLPRIGIALALPMTGPYAKVGTRILRGAGVGQWRQSSTGDELDIRVINTAAPGWVERLDNLPSHFSLVGGPLRVGAFKELLASERRVSILKKRAFFTFLPGLGEAVEGHDAWRFFTSREDEVRSLVRVAVERLGIRDFAVFYPQEKFGQAMSKAFAEEAKPLGAHIRAIESYPPRELTEWNKKVAALLRVPSSFKNNKDAPLPMPDFGAVFIPDGWKQSQNLLPNFFFYEGEQLVFLGPGLWSRALDRAKQVEAQYYKLAICPGAWWSGSDGALALQDALTGEGLGKADFWVALGFDFVRFASRVGTLPAQWTAEEVNARIAQAQGMDFSMAALSWSGTGVARQELFLFTPTQHGKTICNVEKVKARVKRATERRLRRAKAYKKSSAGVSAGN